MSDPFDIAVIGAGPAGGNAALAAIECGYRVVILDEAPFAGGQVWRAKSKAIIKAPMTPESTAGDKMRRAIAASKIEHIDHARVWHISRETGHWECHVLRDGVSRLVQAKALILATGAREFVQPISGWTTPGVIGLAGATSLFKQELSLHGKRTVVSGNGPLVFYVASEIRRLGGTVAAVVTTNTRRDWLAATPSIVRRPALMWRGAVWLADLTANRVPIHWGSAVSKVRGKTHVSGVEIIKLGPDWTPQGQVIEVSADSLCLGHGLIPQIEAAQMLGIGIHHAPALGGWIPKVGDEGETEVEALYLCGDGTGIRGAEAAVHHGRLTGLRAASDMGYSCQPKRREALANWHRAAKFGMAMTTLSVPRPGLAELAKSDTIICRCESLSKGDILAEVALGAGSSNAVKSAVRAGMGPCGGKYCATAVAQLLSKGLADIPPATPRPPLRPVPLASAAGAFDYDDLPIPKPAPL
jgi:thioredoxin reductase